MSDQTITHALARLRSGDAAALDDLFPLIYEELKGVARAQLAGEQAGHTLGPTALVHEAYMNLVRRTRLQPADRTHFLNVAAQTMRRVLIDHARARKRLKRGAGETPVLLEEVHAVMTEKGRELLQAVAPVVAAAEELIFAGVSDEELEQLSELLTTIRTKSCGGTAELAS